MPASPPKLWIDSTQPDSIAGISVGCGFSVQLGDLALQTQLGTVRRKKQFDCRRVETDPMVERRHLMSFVHAADGDHRLENLDGPDQPRITGEQWLECERPVGLDDEIDPVPWDVDPWELGCVDDLVGLNEHHPVAKRGGLCDRRRVLCVGTGEQVAVSVRLRRAQERDVRGQIGEHPRVQLDVGVDGADPHLTVVHHLRDADTIRSATSRAFDTIDRRSVPRTGRRRCQASARRRTIVDPCALRSKASPAKPPPHRLMPAIPRLHPFSLRCD